MSFSTMNYGELVNKISTVCTWLDGLGIRVDASRIGKYKRCLSAVNQSYEEGGIESLLDGEYTLFEIVNAIHESSELYYIYDGLKDEHNEYVRRRIEFISKGCEFRIDDNNNLWRDICFELSLAARFGSKGISVRFDSESDFVIDYEDYDVFFECKRLKSKRKIAKNINQAHYQLKKRYKMKGKKCLGVIGISIDRLVNPKFQFLRGGHEKEIGDRADKYCFDYLEKCSPIVASFDDARTIGLMVELNTPAIIESSNLITTCRHVAARSSSSLNKFAEIVFPEIVKPLQT